MQRKTQDAPISAQGMLIRRLDIADPAEAVDLWERSVRATHDFLQASDIEALRPQVAQELRMPTIGWWLLRQHGRRPCALLGESAGTIEGLFVDPAMLRRGAGTLLIEHVQRLYPGDLRVDVNEQNQRAVRFYRALGFQPFSRSETDSEDRPFPVLHMLRSAR
jgi:putative acetyltransferase